MSGKATRPPTSKKSSAGKSAAAKAPPAKKPAAADSKKKAAPPAPAKSAAPKSPEKPAPKPGSTAAKTAAPAKPVKPAAKGAAPPPAKPIRKSFTIITKKPEPPKKTEPKGPIKLRTEVSGPKKPPVDMKTKPVEGSKQRYSVMTSQELDAVRAAAAKIAAAAGLQPAKAGKRAAELEVAESERLTKSPLTKKELQQFKEILQQKRRELVGDVQSMENEALRGGGGSLSHLPQHMADQGTDTFDQSLNLDLAASQRGIVREIDLALQRIENNTFGICEITGKPIDRERLLNTPWARHSIEAARHIERMGYSKL